MVDQNQIALLVADVFEAAGAARRHGERLAAAAGQTQARWQLLSVASEGDWTVPHIARRLGITRQAVQRTANELLGTGDIRLEPNPNHRSSPLIRLTAAGERVLATMSEAATAWHAELAPTLDAADLAAARRVLQALSSRPPG
jgi:DNA-binding MarR family transcriptional regulator